MNCGKFLVRTFQETFSIPPKRGVLDETKVAWIN
jgi:hypothetical protein